MNIAESPERDCVVFGVANIKAVAVCLAIKSVSRLYPCADLHICEFWHCEYLNIEYGCVHKAMYMKVIMYTSMYTHIVRFVASL